jgi:hypothetical protein
MGEDNSRRELARVITLRCERGVARDKAAQAVERAEALIAEIESDLRGYADLDAKIAEERAEQIKASLEYGLALTMAVSPELSALAAKRIDAENHKAAAEQALAKLRGDLALADNEFVAAAHAVEDQAIAVAAFSIKPLVDKLRDVESQAYELRRLCVGYGAVRTRDSKFLPIDGDSVTLLRSPPSGAGLLRSTGLDAVTTWRGYLDRLSADAYAQLDHAQP